MDLCLSSGLLVVVHAVVPAHALLLFYFCLPHFSISERTAKSRTEDSVAPLFVDEQAGKAVAAQRLPARMPRCEHMHHYASAWRSFPVGVTLYIPSGGWDALLFLGLALVPFLYRAGVQVRGDYTCAAAQNGRARQATADRFDAAVWLLVPRRCAGR